MNEALLGRVAWNIIAKPENLCSSVLIGKYGRQCMHNKECIVKNADSKMWKSINRLWPKLITNIGWEVGNGEKVSFWKDKWIEGGIRLADMCPVGLTENDDLITVKEMVGADGGWNLARIGGKLNEEGKMLLMATLPPADCREEDSVRWGKNLKSTYVVSEM
ncbi:hypothetical protein QN277_016805 [Acacia crassicarpa]|uniref:Uncharacterized protein n=1 Tax=Acacia crassicarpa TaxID=499986 RepID=A0AAE1MXF8_9FABA|nr:hypothetical protein QN277_016805 [Acacia crassicarpa]